MDAGGDLNTVFAELLEDAPCGIVVTDPDGKLQYVNDTLGRWLGLADCEANRPKRLSDLMTKPGRVYYETHLSPMMRLQGFAREISCSLLTSDGTSLPVLLSGVARQDASGKPLRYDYMVFDARERRLYEDELRVARRKAEELAAIVRTSPNAILRVDETGIVGSWNLGAERMLGISEAAALNMRIQDLIRFDDQPDWFASALEVCTRVPEAVFDSSDDKDRHFEITVVPIREPDPSAMGQYSVVLRDITDRKRAERRLKIAMGEMKHRVKNTLAVVSGIARQTLPAAFRDVFIARMAALSRAHDVLTDEAKNQVDVMDLLKLTAEEAGGTERFRITGPSVTLQPDQATSLAMALHELATNALKYGALSVPEGYVQVDCETLGEGGQMLRLVWHEQGGPAVSAPSHQGFGSKMISTVLRFDLGAEVTLDYRPDGLCCEIEFEVRPGA